jgi:hypothetical protein
VIEVQINQNDPAKDFFEYLAIYNQGTTSFRYIFFENNFFFPGSLLFILNNKKTSQILILCSVIWLGLTQE